jgi:hypothetical protein
LGFRSSRKKIPNPGERKRREFFRKRKQEATVESDPTAACNQDDARGFIRCRDLRLKVAAKVQGKERWLNRNEK